MVRAVADLLRDSFLASDDGLELLHDLQAPADLLLKLNSGREAWLRREAIRLSSIMEMDESQQATFNP